ncbi:MAG: DUF3015 family protein [Bdellovibrionota bacterium]
MKKILATLAMGICLFGSQGFAADQSSGCGPGWYLFKDTSLVSSAFRATTNGILFPVTTIGMTVGTSNCSQHKLVKKEMETLHFATMNYYELKGEVAKGNGAYLSAFAETMGCNSKSQALLNSELKNNYKNLFPQGKANPEGTLLEVYKTIFRNQSLTSQCLSLG